ncbi:UNVERIFIED_CONTAM: hypothetical protein FKN15_018611 [Acipenser sinensis]
MTIQGNEMTEKLPHKAKGLECQPSFMAAGLIRHRPHAYCVTMNVAYQRFIFPFTGPRQCDVSANQGFHKHPSQKPQMLGTSLIFSRGAAFRVITLICVFSVTGFSAPGMVAASPPVGDPFLSLVAGPFAPEMMAALPSVGDHLFYPVSVAGSSAPGMCGSVALSRGPSFLSRFGCWVLRPWDVRQRRPQSGTIFSIPFRLLGPPPLGCAAASPSVSDHILSY